MSALKTGDTTNFVAPGMRAWAIRVVAQNAIHIAIIVARQTPLVLGFVSNTPRTTKRSVHYFNQPSFYTQPKALAENGRRDKFRDYGEAPGQSQLACNIPIHIAHCCAPSTVLSWFAARPARRSTGPMLGCVDGAHLDRPRSRCTPNCQETPIPRTMPTTSRPWWRSRIGRQRTSVNWRRVSMTANVPPVSVMACR